MTIICTDIRHVKGSTDCCPCIRNSCIAVYREAMEHKYDKNYVCSNKECEIDQRTLPGRNGAHVTCGGKIYLVPTCAKCNPSGSGAEIALKAGTFMVEVTCINGCLEN